MPSTDEDDELAPLNVPTRATDPYPEVLEKANRQLLEHETERLNARVQRAKENES